MGWYLRKLFLLWGSRFLIGFGVPFLQLITLVRVELKI